MPGFQTVQMSGEMEPLITFVSSQIKATQIQNQHLTVEWRLQSPLQHTGNESYSQQITAKLNV